MKFVIVTACCGRFDTRDDCMAGAVFGISTFPLGISTPSDCAVQSVEVKESVEVSTYRDVSGITVGVLPHKLVSREATIEVVGRPSLLSVITGAFVEGTYKQVSAKFTENVDGPPTGTVSYKTYANVGGGGGE